MGSQATAIEIEQAVAAAVTFAVRAGPIAVPIIAFAASFIPAIGPFVPIIVKALPYLSKVSQYAPLAAKLIEQGKPIFDDIDKAQPQIQDAFKHLVALAKGIAPTDVADHHVESFAVQAAAAPIGATWPGDVPYWDRGVGSES